MRYASLHTRPSGGRPKDSTSISRSLVSKKIGWRVLLATCLFCFFTTAIAQGATPTTSSLAPTSTSGGKNCYVAGGVEHCDDPAGASTATAPDCSAQARNYNKGLRIGAIFIVLATSSIAVFGPVFLEKFARLDVKSIPFTFFKQFGTGVIISTAFVHLLTEGGLMFTNPCVGELGYESTATAVAMAGMILAFIVEYIGDRFIQARAKKIAAASGAGSGSLKDVSGTFDNVRQLSPSNPSHGHLHDLGKGDQVSVLVLESGIIFHSVLIGVTLAVADGSVFTTLLIVIVFHQAFEGLALGSRIAALPGKVTGLVSKLLMCAAFAAITPIGMAIGLGVSNNYNENSKSTLIAMGTLDALSAGILAWVGLVEMLAGDWVFDGGEMKTAGVVKTLVGAVSLAAGMILMSLLGKWT